MTITRILRGMSSPQIFLHQSLSHKAHHMWFSLQEVRSYSLHFPSTSSLILQATISLTPFQNGSSLLSVKEMCSQGWASLKTPAMSKHVYWTSCSLWLCRTEKKHSIMLGRLHWLKSCFCSMVCTLLLPFWVPVQASLQYCPVKKKTKKKTSASIIFIK